MTLTFINSKVEGVKVAVDGDNKKEVKEHLHRLLKTYGMRLTGWKAKDEV